MANAGSINVVLSANATSFSSALTEAQRNLDKLSGKTREFGGHSVSSMQAASASIRLLENPLGSNIRAIERLISQSQVLSGVLKAAFPVVGAIAIGAAIAKVGKEVYDFIDKMNKMPKAISDGFNALNLSARSSNDALDLTNAKLQQEINKLEGKPQNNLKTALYESRVEADKLATSLGSDAKAVNELLTQNKIGLIGQLLGKASTSSVSSSVMSYMNDLQALGNKLSGAAQKPNNDAEVNSLKQQIKAKQDSALSWAKSKLFVTDNPQFAGPNDDIMGGDQASNRAILLGFQRMLGNEQHRQTSEDTHTALEGQKDKDEQRKSALEAQKAAARAALEAQKRAAAEQLAQWESDNSDWKAAQERSLSQDAEWWKAKLATLNTGSINYRAVNKKVNADIIAETRQWNEEVTKATHDYLEDGEKRNWLTQSDTNNMEQQGHAAAEWIKSMAQGGDIQQKNSDALAESSLRMAVATGQMSKMDAAQVLTNLHTQQYADALDSLKAQQQRIESDPILTDLERKGQLQTNANAQASLTAQYAVQHAQDMQAANPASSLASTGFLDALNDFVTASQDAAGQMRQLTDSTLSSLNGEIVKGISGQRTSFGAMGAGIFRNVANTGLQRVEGSALSMLGFGGKADGSESKPFYVRLSGGISSVGNTAGSWLSKMVGGGSSSSSSSSGGGMDTSMSGLTSMALTALPMLASGGPLSANTMAIVGEQGPELFMPSSSGNVIPNHQLGMFGSGDTHHHWNIDAKGATDPAQVRAQVQQGIVKAAPQLVSASYHANQEAAKRRPTTRRS